MFKSTESVIVDIRISVPSKKTEEFLSKKCSDIIQNLVKTYNCQMKSIVTDNATSMEKMRRELELKYES